MDVRGRLWQGGWEELGDRPCEEQQGWGRLTVSPFLSTGGCPGSAAADSGTYLDSPILFCGSECRPSTLSKPLGGQNLGICSG